MPSYKPRQSRYRAPPPYHTATAAARELRPQNETTTVDRLTAWFFTLLFWFNFEIFLILSTLGLLNALLKKCDTIAPFIRPAILFAWNNISWLWLASGVYVLWSYAMMTQYKRPEEENVRETLVPSIVIRLEPHWLVNMED
ncbi:hypothetical protein FRB99_007955 [Tulasnella sp. 403]|nr:hypothetical protein FRB99_007955 [Tulasnella sp. 403]